MVGVGLGGGLKTVGYCAKRPIISAEPDGLFVSVWVVEFCDVVRGSMGWNVRRCREAMELV